MSIAETYQAIALALGLGLLVGLQREWRSSEVAGIRTFPLITLFGTLSVLITGEQYCWGLAAGLVSIACLLLIANIAKMNAGNFDPGITTEIAALLMFCVGASAGLGIYGPAIVTTGIVAVLLHWKQSLHGLVSRIGENDFRGLMHLVLISLVILPILPDRTFGPYDVLNPYRIWLMVVLIVGISMVAYVAYKLLGTGVGAVLGGLLGGLISSTATTVSYARQTKSKPSVSAMAALVIVIASTVVNVRVLFEIAIVAPALLRFALLPILLILLLMIALSLVVLVSIRGDATEPPDHRNPSQLKPAIFFGLMYAAILFIIAAVRHHFGDQAIYLVAMISGLTDVDAITLSTAKLFRDGSVEASTAWRVVVIATMSNLVFKTAAVGLLGNRRLFLYVFVLFGIAFVGSAALLLWWPDIEIPLPKM